MTGIGLFSGRRAKTPANQVGGGNVNKFNELGLVEGGYAARSFFSWAARRDTLREPVFLCSTPFPTARISSD